MRETVIQKHLQFMVRELGGQAHKIEVSGRNGFCDMMCILPAGTIFFAECKRPGKDPRTLQWREIYRLRELGAHSYVAGTIDEVESIVRMEAVRSYTRTVRKGDSYFKLKDWKDKLRVPGWFT